MDLLEELAATEPEYEVDKQLSIRQEKALAQRGLQRLEDEIFEQAAEVVQMAMRFGDVEMGETEPPEAWIEEYGGYEQAKRAMRYVQAAQMSAKDAPAGIKVSTTVLTGLLRSRADRKQVQPLNVQVAVLSTGDAKVYPVQVQQSDE